MPETIACQSRISKVTVYARGAVVTRLVQLPISVPPEACTLTLDGVTPMAEAGSLRVVADGERKISGLSSRLSHAAGKSPAAPETLGKLRAELQRIESLCERAVTRRDHLAGLTLATNVLARKTDTNVAGRMSDALSISALINELIVKLDVEIAGLEAARGKTQSSIDAAELEAAQIGEPQSGPTREISISLAPGSGHLRALEISYAVAAARWWPAYSARIFDHGKHAEFGIEAFVAQSSLEDWAGVALSLCTADMIQDIRLPELTSLRLGRAQPARRKGFRPPPEGLDALFAGYDAVMAGVTTPEPVPTELPKPSKKLAGKDKRERRRDERERTRGADLEDSGGVEYAEEQAASADTSVMAPIEMRAEMPNDDLLRSQPRGEAAAMPATTAMPAGMPMQPQAKSAPAPLRAGASIAGLAVGATNMLREALGGGAGSSAPPPPPAEPEVGDDWLDFDSLELPDMAARGRGRLVRKTAAGFNPSSHVSTVEYAPAPGFGQDVRQTRGMFDHQFDAGGKVEVPSNGRAHRVFLLSKESSCAMRFVCVAGEDDRVFREAEFSNPFEAPLLPGPVDVFVEGALLTTTALEAVDRKGQVRVGLGVEERLRVARNVRASEESKGLLGGTTAVNHSVSIDVSSSLPAEVTVGIIERLPVSDDKEIQVAMGRCSPMPEAFDQKSRGRPVKGGKLFRLAVQAGGKASVSFEYTITLPAGSEIVGGNRRE